LLYPLSYSRVVLEVYAQGLTLARWLAGPWPDGFGRASSARE
jgi:hypothetical protein